MSIRRMMRDAAMQESLIDVKVVSERNNDFAFRWKAYAYHKGDTSVLGYATGIWRWSAKRGAINDLRRSLRAIKRSEIVTQEAKIKL